MHQRVHQIRVVNRVVDIRASHIYMRILHLGMVAICAAQLGTGTAQVHMQMADLALQLRGIVAGGYQNLHIGHIGGLHQRRAIGGQGLHLCTTQQQLTVVRAMQRVIRTGGRAVILTGHQQVRAEGHVVNILHHRILLRGIAIGIIGYHLIQNLQRGMFALHMHIDIALHSGIILQNLQHRHRLDLQ